MQRRVLGPEEIENIAFINAVGVDQAGSGNVLVTFYVVNPDALSKKGGGGAPPAIVTSVEARDVALAVARYAELSPPAAVQTVAGDHHR